MRKVIYTFIIGNYDNLKPPSVVTRGWDYVCFTDNPELKSTHWDIRHSIRGEADRALENKKFAIKHMILFDEYLPGYDLSISVGGQMEIHCDLDAFCDQHLGPGADMMVFRHPQRDCVYQEAHVCKVMGKDDPQRIDAHMKRYRDAGYPAHNGLYSTGVMGRRHDRDNVKAMCRVWFDEFARGSKRDQLSLPYALWRSPPARVAEIDWRETFESRKFIEHPHA